MTGKLYDINTGKLLGEVPNPEIAFSVYIDKTRERLGTNNHLRYGRNTTLRGRRFIDEMRAKGVVCVLDRQLGPDMCILVDGDPEDWDDS